MRSVPLLVLMLLAPVPVRAADPLQELLNILQQGAEPAPGPPTQGNRPRRDNLEKIFGHPIPEHDPSATSDPATSASTRSAALPGSSRLSASELLELQKLLAVLGPIQGFPAPTPDGKYGPNTRRAIEAFQERNGLPVDGQPTDTVLQAAADAVRSLGSATAQGTTRTPSRSGTAPHPAMSNKDLEDLGELFAALGMDPGNAPPPSAPNNTGRKGAMVAASDPRYLDEKSIRQMFVGYTLDVTTSDGQRLVFYHDAKGSMLIMPADAIVQPMTFSYRFVRGPSGGDMVCNETCLLVRRAGERVQMDIYDPATRSMQRDAMVMNQRYAGLPKNHPTIVGQASPGMQVLGAGLNALGASIQNDQECERQWRREEVDEVPPVPWDKQVDRVFSEGSLCIVKWYPVKNVYNVVTEYSEWDRSRYTRD